MHREISWVNTKHIIPTLLSHNKPLTIELGRIQRLNLFQQLARIAAV